LFLQVGLKEAKTSSIDATCLDAAAEGERVEAEQDITPDR
jgi:hypothetical protein